jgi:hypothetical protein
MRRDASQQTVLRNRTGTTMQGVTTRAKKGAYRRLPHELLQKKESQKPRPWTEKNLSGTENAIAGQRATRNMAPTNARDDWTVISEWQED